MMAGFRPLRSAAAAILWLSLLCGMTAVQGCKGDNGVFADAPQAVSDFVYLYFPLQDVDHTTHTDSGRWVVQMHNGPTLTFSSEGDWLAINGNGAALPGQLVFDQFPEPLYDYIESSEQQNGVLAVERNNFTYSVTLLDAILTYTIASGKVTEE